MPETETMKCPFREEDGEFFDCYGKACMAYYEVSIVGCSTDSPNVVPMCRKIMQFSPPAHYPAFNPYQQFGGRI